MTAVYPDKEINAAFKQRKKLLAAYWACFAALAIALIALFVVHYIRVDTSSIARTKARLCGLR